MTQRTSRIAGAVAGCAALVALGALAAPAAGAQTSSDAGDLVALPGSTPAWASPQAKVGSAAAGQQRHVQIALALRDPRGAEALAKSVSTPGSPDYHRFLTSEQFTDRFAATQQTVDQVSSWLRGQGLRVEGVSGNRHLIDVTATNAQLARAFQVSLGTYRHRTAGGQTLTLTAPESPISVPRPLRAAVDAVIGLDDAARTITPQHTLTATPATAAATPAASGEQCAQFWGQSNNTAVPQQYPGGSQSNTLCGYRAPQMRAIYGLTANATGAGTTVGVVGAYNLSSIVSDTNRAATQFGAPVLTPGQYRSVLPASYDHQDQCAPDSWNGEQALDVQSLHEIAPAAGITYYAATSCLDLFGALNKAVSDNTVSVISNSWGYPGESTVAPTVRDQANAIAVQAAVQGQSLVFASGDAGDNSGVNGHAEAGFPASNPWVTAAGGTTVALDENNTIRFTAGWESSGNTQNGGSWTPQQDTDGRFAGGASGGASTLYDAPDYQAGVVPAAVAHGKRAIPDIAAIADGYTGVAVGYTTGQGFGTYAAGGTSLAAPVVAALVSDAQQSQRVTRMGFLNDALYALRSSSAIRDVTPVRAGVGTPSMIGYGNVTVPAASGSYLIDVDGDPQTLQSGPGWDPVTGIGTPAAGFTQALGK